MQTRALFVNRMSYSLIKRVMGEEYPDSFTLPNFEELPDMVHCCGTNLLPDATGRLCCPKCDSGAL